MKSFLLALVALVVVSVGANLILQKSWSVQLRRWYVVWKC